MILFALLTVFLLPGAPALGDDEKTEDKQKKPAFRVPFSHQLKIISDLEWSGLAQLGSNGLTEYVVKSKPSAKDTKYLTFDDSIIVTVNADPMSSFRLQEVRKLIRAEIVRTPYSMADPDKSDAGLATVFSPFLTESGVRTWEMMVVVFDRAQMKAMLAENPQMRPFDAVIKSSVRFMVSHLYPEVDLDFSGTAPDALTSDGFKKLVTKAFSNFMEPTVTPSPKTGA